MRKSPIKFTQAIADRICDELANGSSLRTICLADDLPAVGSVCRWLAENEDFREQYARAREVQADTLADEILDIADDGVNDWVEQHGADGQPAGWEYSGDHIQRSRLRVDARKWIASKLKPKVYGDKQALEVSGQIDLRTFLQSLGEPD